jgi:hypothetical protein
MCIHTHETLLLLREEALVLEMERCGRQTAILVNTVALAEMLNNHITPDRG